MENKKVALVMFGLVFGLALNGIRFFNDQEKTNDLSSLAEMGARRIFDVASDLCVLPNIQPPAFDASGFRLSESGDWIGPDYIKVQLSEESCSVLRPPDPFYQNDSAIERQTEALLAQRQLWLDAEFRNKWHFAAQDMGRVAVIERVDGRLFSVAMILPTTETSGGVVVRYRASN